ncbi:hypothetical protein B5D82_04560 [Cognaticolwellia beringensis]|uniref:Uncharacterized protein n=2 Tax=Cognaticolwellia beringensis TaxID=1967665 RepID=A0A222G5C3_9GAMM|nr:hypothetical protein B5D82_04560 [Cognaticolwellia beringensis]
MEYMTRSKIWIILRNINILFLICVSVPVLAADKLVFATHVRPPLSLYLKEVIQESLKPYAIEVKVIEMPGSRVISQVNGGYADGDLSRVINFKDISDADTSNYRLVNEPIVLTEIVMITLAKKEIIRPITWETINQDKVSFLRGSKTIRKYLNIENRVAVSSNTQVLEMVANKRVNSAIMFASVAKNMLNQSPELNSKLMIQSPPVLSFHLFTYLNKKHADLIPKLELSLKQLKDDGFLENTANKYQVTAASAETFSAVSLLQKINHDKPMQHKE